MIRRQTNSWRVKLWTGLLADQTTHGLDDSWTSQLSDSKFKKII